jgi:dUTP pyrophosphatase
MSVLSSKEIRILLDNNPPIIEDFLELDVQLQNNGFDLTLRSISTLLSLGQIAFFNSERILPDSSELKFGIDGFLLLSPGNYRIIYNEIVHLPKDVICLGFPRSSLLRCGGDIRTAVWDAGYSGRSESLLVVHNPHGLRLERNCRLLQLVFIKLAFETEGYQGGFQGENI